MKRNPKRKLANKMLTNDERRAGVTIFDGEAWTIRKEHRKRHELLRSGHVYEPKISRMFTFNKFFKKK